MLKTSCQTNFRCTRLQFRGMGPIWLMRELPCKNLLLLGTERGHCNYYIQRKDDISGLASWLKKILAVPIITWHTCMQCVKRGSVRNTLCQNAVCSNECFLSQVDYALEGFTFWLSKCALFFPLVSYWEFVTHILIFCSLFLVCMICPLMQEHLLWPLLKRRVLHCS